ncbi:general secretion pathway protein F [Natronocella acetinitrilica]|jgi:general secretion pathway protein F|uniref:General secretion pathway protein F n=1 Tax=Natronocella acetinitrilica TaxID=414046 RepID=A0AAE3G236_9GAMM|nr:type II secretion system inner membrane protein GspF [Natronocella acetinitrilica]MCP1673033.1 general secretion pathway protein F [Natronocella acetinitrilica]
MAAFEYSALDGNGKELKGVLEGDTARQVRQQLREKGWVPLSVDAVTEQTAGGDSGLSLRIGGGLSATELAMVTRQLATLIGSGLPLEEALRATARQNERARTRSIMTAVRARVMEGYSLADGLGQFPRAFPEMFRATVAAGEQTGKLDLVLERLADYTESRQEMQQKIRLALFYPAILVAVAVLVIVLLMTFVVPEVTDAFDTAGQSLPAMTQGMIAISDFLRERGVLLVMALVAAVIGFIYALRNQGFRRRFHAAQLRLPLVRHVVRGANAARFARTFSILANAGVPVLEAMRISSEVVTNLPMRDAVQSAAVMVREGTGISLALERSGQFPPMMLHLVASGENSGRLEQMLDRAATNQEREVQGLISTSLTVMEPLIILTMGAIVLLIVLSIMLPIFQMTDLLN